MSDMLGPRRIVRSVQWRWHRATFARRVEALREQNLCSSTSVVGTVDAVVSLTSFGRRIANAYYSIESIARGLDRPRRLILWLADEERSNALPEALTRLVARGLEIRYCVDYRSHKKYYPYALSAPSHGTPLVTADDDLIYPKQWLRDLATAAGHPGAAHELLCHRARRVRLAGDSVAPYTQWPFVTDTRPSPLNLATSGGGAWFTPQLLDALRTAGDEFLTTSPAADDIWLYFVALRAGIPARQVRALRRLTPSTSFDQDVALSTHNVEQGGNDSAFAANLTAADLSAMRRAREYDGGR